MLTKGGQMENTDKFLINITAVLSKLSKIRIVKKYTSNAKPVLLNSWPLFYDTRNSDIIDYLSVNNNIFPQKIPFVKAYEISYDQYEKMAKVDVDKIYLVFLRNYVELKKIDPSRHGFKDVQISLAYDPKNGVEHSLPADTGDVQGLIAIASRHDVLFLFNSKESGWKAKIRGDLGWFVFSELKWYPSIAFKFVDREMSISKKIEKGDKANRFVTDDLSNYENVVQKTLDNIEKAFSFESWCARLREITCVSEAKRKI